MDNYQDFNIINNISKLIESSFGIYGKSKLISQVFDHIDEEEEQNNNTNVVLSTQKIIFTNDGLTILKSLNNDSPYYKIILQQSSYIKERFGTGVSQYIILTNNILKRSVDLIMNKGNKGTLFNTVQILNTFQECRLYIKNNFNSVNLKNTLNVKDHIFNDDDVDDDDNNLLESIIKTNLSKNILSIYYIEITQLFKQLLKILPSLDKDKIKIITIVSNNQDDEDEGNKDNFKIKLLDGILIKSTFTFAGRDKLVKEIENPKILLLDYEIELKHQKEFAKIEIPNIDQYLQFIDIEKQLVSNQLENIYKSNINLILDKKVIGDLAIQEFVKKQNQGYKINCIGSLNNSIDEFETIKKSLGGCVQASLQSLSNKPNFYGTCKKYEQIVIGKKSYELFKGCPNNTQTIILKGSSSRFLNEAKQGLLSLITSIRSIILDDNFQLVGGSSNFEFIIINLLNRLINEKQIENQSQSTYKEILIIKCLQKSIKDLIKLLILNSNLNLDLIDQLFGTGTDINDHTINSLGINVLNNSIDDIWKLNILESKTTKLSILNSAIETNSILLKTISISNP